MTVLAAPIVRGPVLTTSPVLRVDGVLDGADVVVSGTDGTEYAAGTASANGSMWLTVGRALADGAMLIAAQTRGADASTPSAQGTPVLPPPDTMPAPVFGCVLNQCSDAVLLSGLVPGARVTIDVLGWTLATHDVSRPREWISLGTTANLGDLLRAVQAMPGGVAGPPGFSEPVSATDGRRQLAPPQTGPLTACQSEIEFSGAVPTARVTIERDDGFASTWLAPDSSFRGTVSHPFKEGPLRVRQELTGCEVVSADAPGNVGPEVQPATPYVWWFCPESRRVAVDNLVRGASVEFTTMSPADSGGYGPETPLMIAGAVGGGRQEFELPHVVGGGPGPTMYIRVRQQTCTLHSEPGEGREYPRPGEVFAQWPPPRPQILDPVYSCAQTVRIRPSGWGVGVLRSAATGRQLADAFHPLMTLPVVLPLWFPLAAGDELVVQYTGCNPPPDTDTVRVTAVPARLPGVGIVPPLPGDTDLVVADALPGARVVALLDRHICSVRVAVDGRARLPFPRALNERDLVWAYQRLCGAQSSEDGAIEVRRATIQASASPNNLVVDKPTTVSVTARRIDTGTEVAGLPVSVDGAPVGVTGTPIALRFTTPGAHSGKVTGAPRYTDAAFAFTAVPAAPPPPQSATMTVQLGPVGGYGNPVQIHQVTWRMQPTWGAPAASASGTTGTATFPSPGGSNPRVEIYLDELKGIRWDGGVPFQLHLNALSPMAIVALTSSVLHVGFLLTTEFWPIYDDEGELEGYRWVAIVRFQGVA